MDYGFWVMFLVPFAMGYVVRSEVERQRRIEEARQDHMRRMHPSTRPLHIIDDGWTERD